MVVKDMTIRPTTYQKYLKIGILEMVGEDGLYSCDWSRLVDMFMFFKPQKIFFLSIAF